MKNMDQFRSRSMAMDDLGSSSISAAVRSAAEVLRRRFWTLLIITVPVFLICLFATTLITPRYEATARIKIDPSPAAMMGELNGERASMADQTVVDTEVSAMRSGELALAVAKKIKLADSSVFLRNLSIDQSDSSEAADAMRVKQIAQRLRGNLNTTREKSTFIIDVGFTSPDPQEAANIANAFAREYIDSTLGHRTGTATQQAAFLDQRLRILSDEALAADARLAQYRSRAGIVDKGQASVTDQQIGPLAGQLATAESEAAAARAKLAVARSQVQKGGIDAVSAVLSSDVVRSLRTQRALIVQSQGDALSRYGPKHPETIKINLQLTAIDQQIDAEARRLLAGVESEASSAEARAASLRGNMGRLKGEQSDDTQASVMADSYQRRADAAHAAYNRLAEQAQATTQVARSSLSQAQIIDYASPSLRPVAPNKPLILTAGLMFALLLGTGTIFAQELMSGAVRSISDVEEMGLPVIASIPALQSKDLSGAHGVKLTPADTLIVRPMAFYAEAFRVARSALIVGPESPPRVVAFVSALPGDGKTTSALSFARILALSGEKTLVIDTDLRRAGLKALTGTSATIGLLEVLKDKVEISRAIYPDTVSNLDILPVANEAFLPDDFFNGSGMASLLETLKGRYDRIVIDTPPLLGVADARSVAGLADAVVMVIRWGKTPREAVKTALSWLATDNAKVEGALLTMVHPSAEALGALYYSRRYSQYYKSEG